MKIWYQSGLAMEDYPNYAASLEAGFERSRLEDTEVVLRGRGNVTGKLLNHDVISSPVAYFAVYTKSFMNGVREAEEANADVFVIGTLSEPILSELRCLARIPVVSTMEVAMLSACLVAPKFGMVTLNRATADPFLGKAVKAHGLESRFSNYKIIEPQLSEEKVHAQFKDPAPYMKTFVEAARRCIDDGAQVIIPAEGMLAAMVGEAGIYDIDGAPVIDVVAASINYAELAGQLHKRQGLMQSRVAYPHPSEAAMAQLFSQKM